MFKFGVGILIDTTALQFCNGNKVSKCGEYICLILFNWPLFRMVLPWDLLVHSHYHHKLVCVTSWYSRGPIFMNRCICFLLIHDWVDLRYCDLAKSMLFYRYLFWQNKCAWSLGFILLQNQWGIYCFRL